MMAPYDSSLRAPETSLVAANAGQERRVYRALKWSALRLRMDGRLDGATYRGFVSLCRQNPFAPASQDRFDDIATALAYELLQPEGPILDSIAKLIEYFLENPDKLIELLLLIISLFNFEET